MNDTIQKAIQRLDDVSFRSLIQKNIFKVVLSFIVLFLLPSWVPLYVRAIGLTVFDLLNSNNSNNPLNILFPYKNEGLEVQEQLDVITDLICFSMHMFFITFYESFLPDEVWQLLGLYFWRVIGSVLYLISLNEQWLILFPNYFLGMSLIIDIIHKIKILEPQRWTLVSMLYITKFIQEIILHG